MNAMVYLLQVSACTGIFYCFYYALLSRFTFFTINRWYLVATLLLSFIIPLLTIHVKDEYVPLIQQTVYVNQVETITPIQIEAPTTHISVAETVHWPDVLKTIYFIAATALLIRLLITVATFFAKVRGKKAMRIGRVNILHSNNKLNNGSFFNYIFLNDAELSSEEMQQIIAHEMLHVKLYHSVDRLMFKLAQVVLWFNPFVYLYTRSAEENHEFEVDRKMAQSIDKSNYADLLLHLSVANRGTLYHNFSMVPLKKRITMLFNQPTKNMKKITYVLILPLVVISCLAFANFKTVKKAVDLNGGADTVIVQERLKVNGKPDRLLTDTIVTRQKLNGKAGVTRMEMAAYRKTEDYKQKKQIIDEVLGKKVTGKIKETFSDNFGSRKFEGFIIAYNNHDYFLRTNYGQEKQLNSLLRTGDIISFETLGAAYGKNSFIMLTVKNVYKNGQKIFQLAEADKLPTTAFAYEANKVRFADGQITNIVKYNSGKWKTAQFQTVNGYKFNISFKPNAPAFDGIEDGDHVRFRFVHEVKTGAKTYQTNDWVSISTDIKNYGIKNPELFGKFYESVSIKSTTTSATKNWGEWPAGNPKIY